MRKGQSPKWNAETIAPIFADMVEHAKSLKAVCKDHGVPFRTIYTAIQRHPEIKALYNAAREDYIHSRVQDMDRIALETEEIARARLLVDNIKWEAARIIPKQYGDKVQTEHTGNLSIEIVRFSEDTDSP